MKNRQLDKRNEFNWKSIFFVCVFISMWMVVDVHLPSIASINTARNPIISLNHIYGNMKNVIMAPTNHTANIKSKYDWKSVHAQKYFKSKSKLKIEIEQKRNKINWHWSHLMKLPLQINSKINWYQFFSRRKRISNFYGGTGARWCMRYYYYLNGNKKNNNKMLYYRIGKSN